MSQPLGGLSKLEKAEMLAKLVVKVADEVMDADDVIQAWDDMELIAEDILSD